MNDALINKIINRLTKKKILTQKEIERLSSDLYETVDEWKQVQKKIENDIFIAANGNDSAKLSQAFIDFAIAAEYFMYDLKRARITANKIAHRINRNSPED
jgi:hypothetical protein